MKLAELDLHRPVRERCLVTLAAVVVGTAACGGPTALSPTHPSAPPNQVQQGSLTVNGVMRSYTVVRPSSLNPRQLVPLVVAIHGYTVDSTWMETTTKFDDLARQAGFTVVYPQGINNSWNAGSCCGDNQVDDVAFISRLLDQLVATDQIDPNRIFVTGMSNGGMMAHRLACDLSDRVLAIASVSGALVTTTCNPARPVSVLEIHGSEDSQVPMQGGLSYPSTSSFMTAWARLDGCGSKPGVTKSGITTSSAWSGCREGTRVVLKAIQGAGHSWFGHDFVSGEPDATKLVWDFFSRVPDRR